jgi:hypothetical protein
LIGGLGAAELPCAALADAGNHGTAAQMRARGEDLSQDIADLSRRHGRAAGAERGRLLAELLAAAEDRRDLLADLIEDSPDEVLRLALPDRLLAAMPAEARGWLEQRAEIEGELEVLHIDMPDAAESRFAYFLKTDLGERFSLHFAGKAPGWVSGTAVRAGGVLLDGVETADAPGADGAIAVAADGEGMENLAFAGGNGGGSGTPASGLTNTFGEKHALAIMVRFQDKPGEQPWTVQQVSDLLFGQMSDYYRENSYQQTWFTGDATDWLTIGMNSTVCDYWQLASLAQQAAGNAGYVLADYSRRIYVFPRNACSWAGLATVGGSQSWLNGFLTLRVAAHESGHNFGLEHSRALDCDTPIAGNCSHWTYGDVHDVMGLSASGHFNAIQKDRLGWLGFGTLPPISTIEADGTYSLEPYESPGSGPKALKIPRSVDPVTGTRSWYYVEYRQAIGFDSYLASNANMLGGVVIHSGRDDDGSSVELLDMTPNTASGTVDFNDAALTAGQSFTDIDAGVTITTHSAGGSQASVGVSISPDACVPSNPTIAFASSESEWVPAGTSVEYSVAVTNNDDPNCPDATFALMATSPTGWTGGYDNASAVLAPGATSTRVLTVTSPSSASDGFYSVLVTATNNAMPAFAASANGTYVVSNPLPNRPPVAVNDNATTMAGTAVTMAVLDNDSDPDGDALSVVVVTQGQNGSVLITPDNSITYLPTAGFSGADGYSYTVSDGKGASATATAMITVTAPPNQPPVAINDKGATAANKSVTIAVLANDTDGDGDLLGVAAITQGSKGTVKINANGTLTYTASGSFKTGDAFTYTISDGRGGTAVATVSIQKARRR